MVARLSRRITTRFERGSACRQSVPQLPSSGLLDWCQVTNGVVWCCVLWCGVVWCGVVWCSVVWCGVVWCGVVWCGVVWCAEGAITKWQKAGMSTKGQR